MNVELTDTERRLLQQCLELAVRNSPAPFETAAALLPIVVKLIPPESIQGK